MYLVNIVGCQSLTANVVITLGFDPAVLQTLIYFEFISNPLTLGFYTVQVTLGI